MGADAGMLAHDASVSRNGAGSVKASTPPATRDAAIRSIPPAKLCVACLTIPTRYGPAKPPRFPIELTSAIEPAAAVPLRNSGGIAQNGPKVPQIPTAAIESAPNDSAGDRVIEASTSPAAPTAAQTARCHRRSPLRSDARPTKTIAADAPTNGIADSNPIPKSLRLPKPRIICGSQKVTPYSPNTIAKYTSVNIQIVELPSASTKPR